MVYTYLCTYCVRYYEYNRVYYTGNLNEIYVLCSYKENFLFITNDILKHARIRILSASIFYDLYSFLPSTLHQKVRSLLYYSNEFWNATDEFTFVCFIRSFLVKRKCKVASSFSKIYFIICFAKDITRTR